MPRKVKVFAFLIIAGLFAVSVWASVIAAQEPQPDTARSGSSIALMITTVAGFASLLATHLFQFYRENRNRRWDLEDREASRQEMRKTAETQRVETIQTAIELARVSNINREHVLGAISKNTEITSEASAKAEAASVVVASTATNFNDKLEALHSELAGLRSALPAESKKS
jgi:hypothetical protein